jgi:sugar phosphate isomerase/epimerase
MFKYGVACALEQLSERDPVNLRGSIEEVAKGAKDAGYDAVELQMKNPGQYDGKHMKAVADDLGLKFCAIATGMEYSDNGLSLISDDKDIRRRAIDRLKEHMELAKVLDCAVIVGRMRASIPDFSQYQRYEDYFTEALLELSDYGMKDNQLLVVEPVMRYICNYLNNLPETSDY